MTPEDEQRLKEIEERREALPPGEWIHCAAQDDKCACGVVWNKPSDIPVCVVTYPHDEAGGYKPRARVALSHFIAHSRADIPWLVERVRELEERVETLQMQAGLAYSAGYTDRIDEEHME